MPLSDLHVIAHAGHWLADLAFASPALGFIGWLGLITAADRHAATRASATARGRNGG